MGAPVVTVASGGIAVTEVANGLPVDESTAGGMAVTKVSSGGLPVTYGTGANPAAYASYPAPSGFRWEFVTEDGVVVTDGGIPVVDLVGA